MRKKIALVGNPNSGKTTIFNAMTGASQDVGNWPGVTVEKKEGRLKGHAELVVVDLPGIYSLSPYSPEEVISRNFLLEENPDAIINLVDATNIERNLYLTTQLMELGIPVIIALNMMDLVRKNGSEIDTQGLAQALGCPVIEISALKGTGLEELFDVAFQTVEKPFSMQYTPLFDIDVEQVLAQIGPFTSKIALPHQRHWYAVKLFEGDERVLEKLQADANTQLQLSQLISACEEKLDDDAEAIIINQRYEYITEIVKNTYKKVYNESTLSDKIDRVMTNRVLALPLFAAIMLFVYAAAMGETLFSFGTIGTEWANTVLFGEIVPQAMEQLLVGLGVSGVLYDLILGGIFPGVGAVLGFLPQMAVLFFLLAILEDCGYMARVAFIMDQLFRRFGLSGKSFIPMLVATGCSVPGIMASRTIEQERDRRITVMTTAFMPCGAKMLIVAMFAGAMFGGSPFVAVSAFFIGIAAVVITGVILNKSKLFAGEAASFVMELPPYHMPMPKNVLLTTWERSWSFVKRAGTLILVSSIAVWFLQGYGIVDGALHAVENNNQSLLALIGNAVAWIFHPIGWIGDMAWKATVATLTGLIAKEEVVNTLGVLYHYVGESDLVENSSAIWTAIRSDFTPLSAYSFMVFNLLCVPCMAAVGAIGREMNSVKWTLATVGYMCALAYAASLMVYQFGGLLTGETSFGLWTVVAAILLLGLLYLLTRKGYTSTAHRRVDGTAGQTI